MLRSKNLNGGISSCQFRQICRQFYKTSGCCFDSQMNRDRAEGGAEGGGVGRGGGGGGGGGGGLYPPPPPTFLQE